MGVNVPAPQGTLRKDGAKASEQETKSPGFRRGLCSKIWKKPYPSVPVLPSEFNMLMPCSSRLLWWGTCPFGVSLSISIGRIAASDTAGRCRRDSRLRGHAVYLVRRRERS